VGSTKNVIEYERGSEMKQEDVNDLIGKSPEAKVKNDHDMTSCPNCSNCIRDLRSERDYLRGAFEDRGREMREAIKEADALRAELQGLKKALRESELRGSALSASACVHPRGIVGDERGHAVCPLRSMCGELSGEASVLVGLCESHNDFWTNESFDVVESMRAAIARYRVMSWEKEEDGE
jgi:hypothetical protein